MFIFPGLFFSVLLVFLVVDWFLYLWDFLRLSVLSFYFCILHIKPKRKAGSSIITSSNMLTTDRFIKYWYVFSQMQADLELSAHIDLGMVA